MCFCKAKATISGVLSVVCGYTLSLGHWGTHVVNGAVYALPYDVLKDFEPVALISVSPYFVVGRKELPANDLNDLVQWLKASGEKATHATARLGGIPDPLSPRCPWVLIGKTPLLPYSGVFVVGGVYLPIERTGAQV
jgi:hypothetical protein